MSLLTALTQVVSLLRKAPRESAAFKGFTTTLVGPLRRMGNALKDEDLDYVLDGWDVVNPTGQWARTLLQFSRDPDPEKVERLLVDFLGRGHRFDHLAAHVNRFKQDARSARHRLSGQASRRGGPEPTGRRSSIQRRIPERESVTRWRGPGRMVPLNGPSCSKSA